MLAELIEAFIRTHYGFGNPGGNYWLIGMEEGCGDDQDELFRRFQVWDEMGRGETKDVAEYHFRLGIPQLFRDPIKLQHTWAHLIRLILAAEGRPGDVTAVKTYQMEQLGRPDGETALLELLPLPSPSIGVWPYADWTGLPYLQTREKYRQTCIPFRVAHLGEMLLQHRPRVVVFYGISYRVYYEQVTGVPFGEEAEGAEWAAAGESLCVLVKHPAARGVSAGYFERIGQEVHRRLEIAHPQSTTAGLEMPVEPYGLYKCDRCGKMVMGYTVKDHSQQSHSGSAPGYTKVGK